MWHLKIGSCTAYRWCSLRNFAVKSTKQVTVDHTANVHLFHVEKRFN